MSSKFTLRTVILAILIIVAVLVVVSISLYKIYKPSSHWEAPLPVVETTEEAEFDPHFGSEVAHNLDQIWGTYDMYDGNRFYLVTNTDEKHWLFIGSEYDLYCSDGEVNENSQFSQIPQTKSSYEIAEVFQMGDPVLVGFSPEDGQMRLQRILTNSVGVCE